MKTEKAPPGERSGRGKAMVVNNKACKPLSQAKLDQQWKHEQDKQKVIAFLIRMTKDRYYNIDAFVEGLVECADYLSFSELTRQERRTLQHKILRFVVALRT